MQHVCLQAMGQLNHQEPQKIAVEYLAVKAATVSFANKLFAENVIEIESQYLEKGESHD